MTVLGIGEWTGWYICVTNVEDDMGLKITLLEPHLEGAQIGPQSLSGIEEAAEPDDDQNTAPESTSNLRRVIGLIAVSSLLVAGYRVLRSRNVNISEKIGSKDALHIKEVAESESK